ncbi:protein TIFY 10a-like [Typha angustifolia]|uniref:protein TIFY 10a-like n=1 Tax=Typha angustifolia TaxID=59011 RepID=UPI003C2F2A16
MADMARKSREKTHFAVTCSLLSQYIKEKGTIADLGIGIASRSHEIPKDRNETYRPPTTMCLFPGLELSKEEEGETTEADVSHRKEIKLFPHVREPDKAQLTIFYGGKVVVFDNFPAEKAKDLMQLASKGCSNATTTNFAYAPPSSATSAVVDHSKVPSIQSSVVISAPSTPLVGSQIHTQRPGQPSASDLPIARKASLHRFLEKRKDRLNSKAPYEALVSSEKAAPTKKVEGRSWLGLGSQESSLSFSPE